MKLASLLLVSLLAAIPALSSAQEAPKAAIVTGQAPGEMAAAKAVELQGVISAISKKDRKVTIKGGSGNEYVVVAGPEIKNFSQVKVGDLVTINYFEAMGIEVKKVNSGFRERSEKQEVIRAKPGEKPGMGVSKQVRIVADVTELDAPAGKITLRGPKRTVAVVLKDPTMLKDVKVGDQVEVRYVDATVVSLAAGK